MFVSNHQIVRVEYRIGQLLCPVSLKPLVHSVMTRKIIWLHRYRQSVSEHAVNSL